MVYSKYIKLVVKMITDINGKLDEFKKKLESRDEENKQWIDELNSLAEEATNQGNYFIAAKCLKYGAKILYESSSGAETDNKRESALMYDEASRMYHAINQFGDAADCINYAANIYIELDALKQAIKCYGLAKNYYGDSGDYDKCGEAYINEMECKRKYYLYLAKKAKKSRWTYRAKHLKYTSFKWVAGYGEKLTNLLISSILIILLFTAIYFILGAVAIPGVDEENPFYVVVTDRWAYLVACFKFSISLFSGFSTTPYLLVKYNWVSTVEVIIGNLILAIFIAIILRKISRR